VKAQLSVLGVGNFVRRVIGIRLGRLYQYPPRPLTLTKVGTSNESGPLPKVSLVTPSFNQAQFLGKTIESVLGQGYPDLEYCVQDAGSTDGSAELLRAFKKSNITVRIERDAGQADALNRGFAGTSGEIMGYLNSDDFFLPGTLHLVGAVFRDHPEVDVIYGNRLIVDEEGFEIGRWILPGHDQELLRFVDYVPQESMFWRRRIWEKIGAQFNEKMQFAMDWELILRFISAGASFKHVPELVGIFRVHSAQKSQANFVANGFGEIDDLRSIYRDPNRGGVARFLRHARYLYAHRLADADYEIKLQKMVN